MTTLSRRTLLSATSAVSLTAILAACADTGADGQAVSGSGETDYDTVINSGPVAAADVVAASTWASAIKEAGVLKTGGTKTAAIFSSEDTATGKVTGFDAAIAQTLARYIIGGDDARALVEITQVQSDTREAMLENGSVQAVIATYSISPERAEKVDFAGPYYSSGQAVLVRDDEDKITGVGDLAGVKVAVQSSSSSVGALEKAAPEAQQIPFHDQPACLNGLKTKQVDAYVVDYPLLLSALESNEGFKIVGDTFTEELEGIGLPRKSDAKAFVNTFLQTIYDDGTWASIWKATIGAVIGGEAPEPPTIGSAPGSETEGASTPTAQAGSETGDDNSAEASASPAN